MKKNKKNVLVEGDGLDSMSTTKVSDGKDIGLDGSEYHPFYNNSQLYLKRFYIPDAYSTDKSRGNSVGSTYPTAYILTERGATELLQRYYDVTTQQFHLDVSNTAICADLEMCIFESVQVTQSVLTPLYVAKRWNKNEYTSLSNEVDLIINDTYVYWTNSE